MLPVALMLSVIIYWSADSEKHFWGSDVKVQGLKDKPLSVFNNSEFHESILLQVEFQSFKNVLRVFAHIPVKFSEIYHEISSI